MTLYWNSFEFFSTLGPFDCPLCKAHIPRGVHHQCSNPEPSEGKVTKAKVTLKDGRKGTGRTLQAAILDATGKPKRGRQ